MEALVRQWGSDRVQPVVGDLTQPALGVDAQWVAEHAGQVEHFFHLAAIYDITADDATNDAMNIEGTRNALALGEALQVGTFHQVSSVAAAGDFRGRFDETMFEEGQPLPSPYHRTKYESEKIVRDEASVPWRVYRPAIVVGHSETGAMDKIDGPYYFFPLIKRLRDSLPSWLPLVGVDLGDTNLVPVDYVAKAMDHLAHLPARDGEAFHLVNPEPQPVVEMINAFCAAAGAPRFATPVNRSVTTAGPLGLIPRALRPINLMTAVVRSMPAQTGPRPDDRPARHPGGGAGAQAPSRRSSTRGSPRRRSPAPGSACRRWRPTSARCGPTGRRTSTTPSAATPRRVPR
ncbi:SDR family oxidoreductase [Nocardioides convexus]|uniref:SDR family oxidoreductase n=1 Tax=Nocardioides convexus TaxID=2712224 RepID=UPI00241838AF|nr:SDR family oxidoreductase [Nocardioides convexus]